MSHTTFAPTSGCPPIGPQRRLDGTNYAPHIQKLVTIPLPLALTKHGYAGPRLALYRIWPKSREACGLAFVDTQGKIIPGHWFASERKLNKYLCSSRDLSGDNKTCTPIVLPSVGVVLLPAGADPELPGLHDLVAQSNSTILVHRPGKRAVVRLKKQLGASANQDHLRADAPSNAPSAGASPPTLLAGHETIEYVKVVRPQALTRLANTLHHVSSLVGKADSASFSTPAILHTDAERGRLNMASLRGTPLLNWYDKTDLAIAAQAAGRALAALHRLPIQENIPPHDAGHEVQTLEKWFNRLETIAPELSAAWQPRLRAVSTQLLAPLCKSNQAAPVLLHRDFYDKQVFIEIPAPGEYAASPYPNVGILDFDTLAAGEASLDLANALVHFELRAHLGLTTQHQAEIACRAFLSGYSPTPAVKARLAEYANATRLRLACVYACRPQSAWIVHLLIERLGAPVCACG